MEENIKKLIKCYENKIEWLKRYINTETDESNRQNYHGIIDGLETAIYDLNDILDGIEM
jgi:hypothetical protein